MAFLASLSGRFSVLEGETATINLVLAGNYGSVYYSYHFEAGTAGSGDFRGGSGSGSYALSSTSTISKTIPISFSGVADTVDEADEHFSLVINLSGASFADGSTSKVVDLVVLDDLAWHGTEKADVLSGTATADTIFGYGGKDVINGGDGNDKLFGGGANDQLFGGRGADKLDGGLGNDTLVGGSGKDVLEGGAGDDNLTGGAHADIFVFSGKFGNDTITDFSIFGGEKVDLQGVSDVSTFRELKSHMEQVGDDVILDFGKKGSITLSGIDLADLTKKEFIFSEASGSVLHADSAPHEGFDIL